MTNPRIAKNTIYVDHSATTPVAKEVLEAMTPYFSIQFGNASSNHFLGIAAKNTIEEARKSIASCLNVSENEIYFTSGGTESDNWAIKGFCFANRDKGNHIITTQTEHEAIINSCKNLENYGFKVSYIPVDKFGQVHLTDIKKSINKDTILISTIHGNNEIGTINPINEISELASKYDIAFHTDAVQTFGKIPINLSAETISLLSLSSHKIYGPKGIAALYVRKGTKISKLIDGGGHEKGMRAGTENVAGIVGFAKASELAHDLMDSDTRHLHKLRTHFEKQLIKNFGCVKINTHPKNRLEGILNVTFRGYPNDVLLLKLNSFGIAASSGSACSSRNIEPSKVLLAMGINHEDANSSIRFSLGRKNNTQEIDYIIKVLKIIIN